ncbi:LytR/AlgR family response regulator transcription factor [Marinoscillum furvescens]|uniref:LytTR family two component transcriptional regulator n=1 Tax=Marinoscillum furvescens DSM 4134 TaxID=1122208 RepID=A0A3D9L581_MARFU|nr:response regulator [Marinoscillum furvescens]REE01069.1 LytTR family two component transcriptional regulator [Marinoscillum furvescens DSM 4134]
MEYKILIVEDDPLIADSLEVIVEDANYRCCGKAESITEALNLISDTQPDLLLLDINLEGKNEGIELAEIVRKREKIPLVFITAYSDEKTVDRASKTNPLGYLIKPFREAEVRVALKLAFAAIEREQSDMENLMDADGTVYVKDRNGYLRVNIPEIMFIQANDVYSHVITNNIRCMISKPLKQVEEIVRSYGFMRVHKSYVVNKKAIKQIKDQHLILGEHAIPIGRVYREELMQQLRLL